MATPPNDEALTALKGIRFDLQRLEALSNSPLIRRPVRTVATGVLMGAVGTCGLVWLVAILAGLLRVTVGTG